MCDHLVAMLRYGNMHTNKRSLQAKDVVALVAIVAQNHLVLSLWVSADFTPYVRGCLRH